MSKQLKQLPKFADEDAERNFWENHDSSEYMDWSKTQRAVLPNLKPTTIPDGRKTKNDISPLIEVKFITALQNARLRGSVPAGKNGEKGKT